MKKYVYLYGDFETTTVKLPKEYATLRSYYENHPNPKFPEVYSWAVTSLDPGFKNYRSHKLKNVKYKETKDPSGIYYKSYYGIDGKSFIDFIATLNFDTKLYFNNLSKFDGHFIYPLLDKHGYEIVYDIDFPKESMTPEIYGRIAGRIIKIKEILLSKDKIKKEYEKFYNESPKKGEEYLAKKIKFLYGRLAPKEYKMMYDDGNNITKIQVGIDQWYQTGKNGKQWKNRVVTILDSLSLFKDASIAKMGDTLGLVHGDKKNIEFYKKKEISGGYNRTELYKSFEEFENDGNELEYLLTDSIILCAFHDEISKVFPRKDWQMTIASTSYKSWQKFFGKYMVKKMEKIGAAKKINVSKGFVKYTFQGKKYKTTTGLYKAIQNMLLPTKWLNEDYSKDINITNHSMIYKWYIAGRVMVNEDYRGKLVNNLTVLDINSSFPAQQNSDILFPFGEPVKGEGDSTYNFHFYELEPLEVMENEKGLPFLTPDNSPTREYPTKLTPGKTYRFTSISYKNFLKYYKGKNYKLKIVYSFRSIKAKEIFGSFVDYWYGVKEKAKRENNPVLAIIAKYNINSNYGKFGSGVINRNKAWQPFSQEFSKYTTSNKSKYYLPLAIAIVEAAAMQLVDGVGDKRENFVYCDTDSLFIKDFNPADYPGIKLDPFKLGYWDVEYRRMTGIARRPKQYLFKNKYKHEIKISYSGINFKRMKDSFNEIKFNDYIIGKTLGSQLSSYTLSGHGIVINESLKEIRPVWDYPVITGQKFYEKKHFSQICPNLEILDEYMLLFNWLKNESNERI